MLDKQTRRVSRQTYTQNMSGPFRFRHGFILLVVVGVLGVLSAVSLALVNTSNLSMQLSRSGLQMSRTRLLAYSGVELGLARYQNQHAVGTGLSEPIAGGPWTTSLGASRSGIDSVTVAVDDANGRIFLNDGISAGKLELGALYESDALDPWASTTSENLSAVINLRLRRLLNAYGDAHRFVEDVGWPVYQRAQWDAGQTGGYGSPFNFTCSAAGDKYTSQPAADGFGDLLIASRPDTGWRDWNDIKPLVENWGETHGLVGFSAQAKKDLGLMAWEDTHCSRMSREIGPDADGDGYPDFENDVSTREVPVLALDAEAPDLSGLWRPHAVAPIHFNRCSRWVRAAIFYAPVNVSYVCEGLAQDRISYPMPTRLAPLEHHIATLGTGGPIFESTRILENGVAATAQKNRLMSLRDAWVWSLGYEELGQSSGFPASFVEFRLRLRELEGFCPPLERATPFAGIHSPHHLRLGNGSCWFTQRYLEYTLPQIFDVQRRLPGWWDAPVALMSPYVQQGVQVSAGSPPGPGNHVLRSVEDTVWRMPHPKIDFLTSGLVEIDSQAEIAEPGHVFRHRVQAVVEMFQHKVWRSQKDFETMLPDLTRVTIGPEPVGLPPSAVFGTIGPGPHAANLPGTTVNDRLDLLFEGNLNPEPGSALLPENANLDPWIDAGAPPRVDVHVAGYPAPGRPFNGGLLDILRNTAPDVSIGETWLIPRLSRDVLIEFVTPMLGFPPSEAQMRSFLTSWLTSMGEPIPPQGDPQEWDMYAWSLVALGFLDWHSDNPLRVSWAEEWSNHEPGSLVEPDSTALKDSQLEDSSVSLFLPGSGGCDLSPFGGVSLSSRGHGARAPGVFSDSLYLRPYRLMSDPDHTGRMFNRGVLSCWVRVPSGYVQNGMVRTVSHLTLWEHIQLKSGAQINSYQRPIYLSLQFRGTTHSGMLSRPSTWEMFSQFDLGHGPDLGGEPSLEADHRQEISEIPYPLSVADAMTPPQSWSFASPQNHGQGVGWENYYKESEPYTPRTRGACGIDPYGMRRGGWVRVVMRWDLRNLGSWVHRHDFHANANRINIINGVNGAMRQASFNGRMLWSFGEVPCFWRGSLSESSYPVPLTNETFVPSRRLNSLIDDVRIFFGDVAGLGAGVPLGSAVEADPASRSTRYRIEPGDEPYVDLDPGVPEGSKIILASARIYDVPYETDLGDPAALRWPRVDLDLMSNGTEEVFTGESAPVEDGEKRTSPAWRAYPQIAADPTTRLRLTWRSETPSGLALFDEVFDAPWVEDLHIRYQGKTSKILSWMEN